MRQRLVQVLAALGILAMLLVALPTTVQAHPEGKGSEAPLPEQASTVMRAKFADQLAPIPLPAISGGAACVGGLANGYPCSNIDLEAFVPLADMGGASNEEANDIWGWTDAASGREFAIMGMTFGTAFVEVTNPQAPIYVGDLHTHGAFGSSWRDIKVYNDHAFIVSEARNHGMQVLDLRQLLNVSGAPVTFGETAHYNKIGSAHNIVINEDSGFAYAVGVGGKGDCNGGLHMIDISTPGRPRPAGCYSADGYTHDAQCVIYNGPDADYTGREICLNSNEDTLTIVDVTNKSNPVMISRTGYTHSHYTHQGWLTEDHAYFLLDDELDEVDMNLNTRTLIVDVRDLDAPNFFAEYSAANGAIDHNQYIKGNYSYQANYRAGLRILDITDVANGNLSEVGFFDVWPEDDANQFNGAWSNYPYFDSGTVVVSSIEHGLFVLRPDVSGPPPPPPSDLPPTVAVTNPVEGQTIGGTVTLTADAADDFGVVSVEFSAGGVEIGTDTDGADGWSVDWDTTGTADGSAFVVAMATDTIGQTASNSVGVTVDNGGAGADMTVSALDGTSSPAARGGKWNATATVTISSEGSPVAGATVSVSWSTGGSGSCVTNGSGNCSVSASNLRRNAASTTVTVTGVSAAGLTWDGASATVTIAAP